MKIARIALGAIMLLGATALYAQDLPLTHLQLFSSGVGYFERSGKVTDDATVQLSFRTEEVNDLLKSMVLFDLDGGKIGAVNYGTQDPISKTLGSYAININDNPSMGKLLDRLRGVSVEIEATKKITGKIIGVEVKQKAAGDKIVTFEQLNLITNAGIKSINLDEISSLKILDERLNKELQNALTTLASGLDNQRKPVSINFLGKGERRVAVGYIEKTPIWKTSYRVVIGDKASSMQGWAIVENTSDSDWNNVNLSLVSGRPISFMQDLYTPLYLQRPMVQSQLYASIRPVTYAGGITPGDEVTADMPVTDSEMKARNNAPAPMFQNQMYNSFNGAAPAGKLGSGYGGMFNAGNVLRSGVESAVKATNLGEAFTYDILEPVTLARQQSALLPILNSPVDTTRVSIYNDAVHASYPLYGLKLKNNTGINLMGGPVTVYEGNTYAGDATFEDLNPGEERLVSYALDLGVTCLKDVNSNSTRLAVGIKDGQWKSSWKRQQITTYTFQSKDARDRNMLVEHHITQDYKLIEPEKALETTPDLYRFAVTVNAKDKKAAKLKVVEEKTDFTYEGISSQSIDWMLNYTTDKDVSDKVKQTLKQIIEMKKNIDVLRQTQQDNRVYRQQITDEQNRIRQNMNALDRNSDLYKRYVTKFNEQETKMENLLESDDATLVKLRTAEKDLNDFLSKLTVE
ncbi:MAG: hypothetical protein WCO98_02225 [bacterium]